MSHPGFLKSVPSPQDEFFTGLPPELKGFSQQLLGCIDVPSDQPNFSQAIHTLSGALVAFAREHEFYRDAEVRQFELACQLAAYAKLQIPLDGTPLAHMTGRLGTHGSWALCTEMDPRCLEIPVALGVELALALAQGRRLQVDYLKLLRRDLKKIPAPGHEGPETAADLRALGVGKYWRQAFAGKVKRLEAIVAQRTGRRVLTDVNLSEVALEHKAHVRATALNANVKVRSGARNHRQLTAAQMDTYQADLRSRLAMQSPGAVVEAISLFTGLSARGAMTLALGGEALPGELLTLDLKRGGLHVAINHLSDRQRWDVDPGQIYLPVRVRYFVPWPIELLAPLRDLAATARLAPDAWQPVIRVVDILPQGDRDHQITAGASALAVDEPDTRGFTSTAARARNTFPTQARESGMKATHRAYAMFRLDQVGHARPWYVRVDNDDFVADWCKFLVGEGWSTEPQQQEPGQAFGSPYLPRDRSLQAIWGYYVQRVDGCPKGRRMSLSTVIDVHNAYADFTAMALSFLLGLRLSTQYELNADSALPDAEMLTLTDKSDPNKTGSRFAVLTPLVRELLANWYAHCAALLGRYQRDPQAGKTTVGAEVMAHLAQVVQHDPVPALFRIYKNGARPANSKTTWDVLPPLLRCEDNVGRHYWCSQLHRAGCSDKAIDLFMRHIVAGNSPMSVYAGVSIAQLTNEVGTLQMQQIAKLGLGMATGLRKA